jgi:hypothetical protein
MARSCRCIREARAAVESTEGNDSPVSSIDQETFFFFFFSAGVLTQGFAFARQALYFLSFQSKETFKIFYLPFKFFYLFILFAAKSNLLL